MIKCTAHLGECAHQAPGHLSCSDLGRAQNADPTKSTPLWSTQEPEPGWLRPGKCTQPRAHLRQFHCRAPWTLSNVDWESTHAVSRGKPSVAEVLQALPLQVGSVSYHLPPLPPPRSSCSVSWVRSGSTFSGVLCVSFGELTSGCDSPGDVNSPGS